MHTTHSIFYEDAGNLSHVSSRSVNLIVTSPPYPMIAMWDEIFSSMNPEIQKYLEQNNGDSAFKLMHHQLAKVWCEISRVLKPGGFVCINIGDATRTIGKIFKLYPNHVNIIKSFMELDFHVLPEILWRKPTNSPTKFMGSGMLPCGAYVTLEHERILIFRKPGARIFSKTDEKLNRRSSSYFWEERNKWFSDLWDFIGANQSIKSKTIRQRSGAFPLEIPLRLIQMYSVKGDTVLDPFVGTGTTTLASIMTARNSVCFEIDTGFKKTHRDEITSTNFINAVNSHINKRIQNHLSEMDKITKNGKTVKYTSKEYGFPVMTRQETDIMFEKIEKIDYIPEENTYSVSYLPLRLTDFNTAPETKSPNSKLRVSRCIYKN